MDFDEQAEILLSLFELGEILEENNLTEIELVSLLLKHGYITLPDWLERGFIYEEDF